MNWAQTDFRYEESTKYKPDSNWAAWAYSQVVELLNEGGEQMGCCSCATPPATSC